MTECKNIASPISFQLPLLSFDVRQVKEECAAGSLSLYYDEGLVGWQACQSNHINRFHPQLSQTTSTSQNLLK